MFRIMTKIAGEALSAVFTAGLVIVALRWLISMAQ